MHNFYELVSRNTIFTIKALNSCNNELVNCLEESASTTLVKNLQMLQFQKVILVVGMFSIFDSELQTALSSKNGFRSAREILKAKGEIELEKGFNDYSLAINVLKHGHGTSYKILMKSCEVLPFEIITPDSSFYIEGDISEVNTLIKVDDTFVINTAELITKVSKAILD